MLDPQMVFSLSSSTNGIREKPYIGCLKYKDQAKHVTERLIIGEPDRLDECTFADEFCKCKHILWQITCSSASLPSYQGWNLRFMASHLRFVRLKTPINKRGENRPIILPKHHLEKHPSGGIEIHGGLFMKRNDRNFISFHREPKWRKRGGWNFQR